MVAGSGSFIAFSVPLLGSRGGSFLLECTRDLALSQRVTGQPRPWFISSYLILIENPSHMMAPRKKTEEKATANEAADMVLHYLRKSPTHLACRPWSAKTLLPLVSRTDCI